MNPHEYEVLRRFADAMTACYFDSDDNAREALDILNRLLDAPWLTTDHDIFDSLERDAKYALNSHSRDLVYKTYGAAAMARSLGAITHNQFVLLNDMLVTNGLNNPRCRLE